jgi:outer membrane lipoprotein-sorting protein
MMKKTILIAGLFASIFIVPAQAQKKAPAVSATAVMMNTEKGFEGIRDFVATIEAEVDMERIRVPKVSATMYFKKPDKVHFSSTSFAMLPREGLALNPSLLRERYEPKLLGEEMLDGGKTYKLELTAREAKIRPSQLTLWIDPTTWSISRMETVPYQGRILRLVFTYASQAGGYLLPKTMKASFEVAVRDSSVRQFNLDIQSPPQFDETPRPSRSGSITVKYLEYKVNVGLSDDLFEKKEEVPKGK